MAHKALGLSALPGTAEHAGNLRLSQMLASRHASTSAASTFEAQPKAEATAQYEPTYASAILWPRAHHRSYDGLPSSLC